MENLNPSSINDSFYKYSPNHLALNKVKMCMTKCSNFDQKEIAHKEKECVEKCFYNIIENENMQILK